MQNLDYCFPQYAYQEVKEKANFASREMVLELCAALALRVPGSFIEFGVGDGDSTRVLARRRQGRRLYALDSFKGLREKYESAEVGTFARKPPRISGAEIVEGYFEESLTPEFAQRVGRIAFAHLDADLYSSTLCALNWITPLLDTGSILLFDEFLGENASEERALQKWVDHTGIKMLLVAQFSRDPSGFGTERTDVRTILQVVGPSDMSTSDSYPELRRIIRYYRSRAKGLLGL